MAFLTPRELADKILTDKAPTGGDRKVAAKAMRELRRGLCWTLADEQPTHDELDAIIRQFLTDIDGAMKLDSAYAEGTEVIRILARVKACAARYYGLVDSPVAGVEEWSDATDRALMDLELAVYAAIEAL